MCVDRGGYFRPAEGEWNGIFWFPYPSGQSVHRRGIFRNRRALQSVRVRAGAHAGDLPPLLSCQGNAYLSVKTDRFSVNEIIGRTVVIHSNPDDFHTQPAGNAGKKIACGVIQRR